MYKPIHFILSLCVAFIFTSSVLFAQSPRNFTYQGVLVGQAEKPLEGTHTITVSLYDDPSEGIALHSETFMPEVSGGVFNVTIGSQKLIPSTVNFDKQYWLSVSVDGGAEMTPRTKLSSVPFALHADKASDLAKGAHGAVTSLNGKSGDVILQGGPGTLVNSDGNTITISTDHPIGGQETQAVKWDLNGNTPAVGDFLGSIGLQDVVFESNSIERMRIRTDGGINLPNTTTANIGVIMKAGSRFIHNVGSNNTFVGVNAGNLAMTGGENTGFGDSVLFNNTSGLDNTASGILALFNNTIGLYNTAMGDRVLYSNTSGTENTAMGRRAMQFTTSGSENTAVGVIALISNTTGLRNSAFGNGSLFGNTTGFRNTGCGWNAGFSNATGNSNTFVGYQANTSFASNLNNATAVGANAMVCASNTMVFGDTNVTGWGFGKCPSGNLFAINGTTAVLTAGGTWQNASDANTKENFEFLNGSEVLQKINRLPVTKWNYIVEGSQVKHIGPMAQDFQRIFEVGSSDKAISTIDPSGIALIGVQELAKEVADLKADNTELRKELAEIKAMLKK